MSQRVLAAEDLGGGIGLAAAISRFHSDGEAPMEVETGLVLATRDGRTFRAENYDPDLDLVLARYDELRAELLGEATEHPMAAAFRDHGEAIEALDFDRLGRLFADDYVWVSHQSGKREENHGPGAGLAVRRAALDVEGVAGMSNEVEMLETRGDHLALVKAIWRGDFAGGPFEMPFLGVVETDAHQRFRREEAYDLDDIDSARMRLDELAIALRSPAELFTQFADAVNQRDFERMRAMWHPDFRHSDHRPMMRHDYEGQETSIETWMMAIRESPDLRVTLDVLRERGDVVHVRFVFHSDAGGFVIEHEQVVATRDGLALSSDIYEPGAPEAVARFEELTGMRQAHEAHLRAFAGAINAADGAALRALLTDDFRQIDYRAMGAAELDADGFVDMIATAREVVEDLHFASELLVVDGDRRVTRSFYTGEMRDGGGPADLQFFNCAVMRDGRLASSDLYGTFEEARSALKPAPT